MFTNLASEISGAPVLGAPSRLKRTAEPVLCRQNWKQWLGSHSEIETELGGGSGSGGFDSDFELELAFWADLAAEPGFGSMTWSLFGRALCSFTIQYKLYRPCCQDFPTTVPGE